MLTLLGVHAAVVTETILYSSDGDAAAYRQPLLQPSFLLILLGVGDVENIGRNGHPHEATSPLLRSESLCCTGNSHLLPPMLQTNQKYSRLQLLFQIKFQRTNSKTDADQTT